MKKILFIALMSMFVLACSDDETTDLLQPTIEDVNFESSGIGDIITIPGKGFNENGTYSVKFNKVEGKVTEIKPTYLKVEVPEDATSGDITITYDGITIKVGAILITKFPTVESISPAKVKLGEIVTIRGLDFTVGETYSVKFKTIEGTLTEIDSKFLKVEVPEGAETGEMTLTYKDETKVIGTIEIDAQVCSLYAFKFKNENIKGYFEKTIMDFMTINPETGVQTSLINLGLDKGFYSPVFDKSTNQVYVVSFEENEDEPENVELVTIKLDDNSQTSVFLDVNQNEVQEMDYELVIGNDGSLYAFKFKNENINGDFEKTVMDFMSINPETGVQTSLINLGLDKGFYSPVFDKSTNQVYVVSFEENEDEPEKVELVTIKLDDNSQTSVSLDVNQNEVQEMDYELVIGNEGSLYAFKFKNENIGGYFEKTISDFMSINPETGVQTSLINLGLDKGFYSPVFDKSTNQIYAISFEENGDDPEKVDLVTIKLDDNSQTSVSLDMNQNEEHELDYELVIAY